MKSLAVSCRPVLALLLCAVPVRAQQVWVVDGSGAPGADFLELNPAVQAASDGDVVVVRNTPGLYHLFQVLDGRGVTIVADGSGVQVATTLTVRNLAADQRVVLRGLTLLFDDGMKLESNEGLVWIEDCHVFADPPGCFGCPEYAAVRATDSRLVVVNSHLDGAPPWIDRGTPASPGLRLEGATAAVLGGSAIGGEGNDPYGGVGAGSAGVEASASFLLAADLELAGGPSLGPFAAAGGDGIVLANGSTAWLRRTAPQGGLGAPPGTAVDVDGSSALTTRAQGLPRLEASSPVHAGETLDLTFRAAPGELFLVRVGTQPALAWEPETVSFRLVDPLPSWSLFLGVVPASGVATHSAPLPPLGLAPFRELFLQVQQPTAHHLRREGTPSPRWSTATSVLQLH